MMSNRASHPSRIQQTDFRASRYDDSSLDDHGRHSDHRSAAYDAFTNAPNRILTSSDRSQSLWPQMSPDIQNINQNSARPLPLNSARQHSFVSDSNLSLADLERLSVSNPSGPVRQPSQETYSYRTDAQSSRNQLDHDGDYHEGQSGPRYQTRRRPFNSDEFDGPSQLLPLPLPQQEYVRSQNLPPLPVHLSLKEQDDITQHVNNVLSQSAFHFVAKYQFPIPIERDKPRVRNAADREWTEWAYLLKRLATKRRIPARVLFDNQIKQFVTTLENSIGVRPSTKGDPQTKSSKDDRYMLQLISAGTQVAKILVDSQAMDQLNSLYNNTESVILERRTRSRSASYS